jgi:hypothetical protein
MPTSPARFGLLPTVSTAACGSNHDAGQSGDANIAIVGPDDVDGPGGSGLTVALEDTCGTQGGVVVSTGSVRQNNLAFSILSGSRLTNS